MSGLQRQLLLASLMVSHHRTYPPHDRPLRITPRNTLSLWFLYQFLMVLSRFLFAANQSVRGRSVWRIVRRLPRREKPREIGQNADHPLVSPQMMSGKRRSGDQSGWLLHSPASYAPGQTPSGSQAPRRIGRADCGEAAPLCSWSNSSCVSLPSGSRPALLTIRSDTARCASRS
jgi:hypothetical protein